MESLLTSSAWLAISLFVVAYIFIISEKIHKTVIVLIGSLILFSFHIYKSPEFKNQLAHALEFIDFNVLSLIIGMMIIVQITARSGVFTVVAMQMIIWSKGRMKRVFVLLMLLTALFASLLSTVTAVVLLTPIFLAISLRFKLNPIPFLMTEMVMADLGGTATPLGDPTALVIATKAGFSFSDVVMHTGPFILFISLFLPVLLSLYWSKELCPQEKEKIYDLKTEKFIKDYGLMYKGLTILFLVILALAFKNILGLENGVIAIGGAAVLLLLAHMEPEEALAKVDWSIIFFFVGLFLMIGALEITGAIEALASVIVDNIGTDVTLLSYMVLFLSAPISAFVDNIPFATAMMPVIQNIGQMANIDVVPVYWALMLGACIGGAGTIVGTSSNLIVVSIAHQNGVKELTFIRYLLYAFPIMIGVIGLASVYLYLFLI